MWWSTVQSCGSAKYTSAAVVHIDNLSPRGIYLNSKILVDDGMNYRTSSFVLDIGSDVLVFGAALFQHLGGFLEAVKELFFTQ